MGVKAVIQDGLGVDSGRVIYACVICKAQTEKLYKTPVRLPRLRTHRNGLPEGFARRFLHQWATFHLTDPVTNHQVFQGFSRSSLT
jgi:hypothetical protein